MFGRIDELLTKLERQFLQSYLVGLKGRKTSDRIIVAMSCDAAVAVRYLARNLDHKFLDAAIDYYRKVNAVAELSDLAGLSDVSVSNRKSKKKG